MKKMTTKLTSLMIALLAMTFVSCDEDVETAIRLDGEWTGNMGMFYSTQAYDAYGRPMYDRYGSPVLLSYQASYTNIRFYWDGGSHGHGEQIDFYAAGPYRYQSYYFTWRVVNNVIQMRYRYDHNLDSDIYRWDMSWDYGHEYFYGFINNRTRFDLVKLTDFNSWNCYNVNTGYGYYEYPYYGKTRAGETLNDSVSAPAELPKVVKRGSTFF